MKRRSTTILRWSLTGAAVLLAALWAVSEFYIVVAADDGAGTLTRLYEGRVIYASYETLQWPGRPTRLVITRRQPADSYQQYGALCHEASVSQPLWHYIAIAGTPAFFMWRRHLRGTPGACRNCGYDLAGLRSLVCPECGLAITAPALHPAPHAL